MQRYAEAEETYAECERQAPNDVDRMLFVRGTNYLHMKEFEKSRTYLAAALARSPDHEPTLINYGGQCILPVHTMYYQGYIYVYIIIQKHELVKMINRQAIVRSVYIFTYVAIFSTTALCRHCSASCKRLRESSGAI